MSTDRPVMIAVLEYGELPEMLRVANLIRDELKHRVIVAFLKTAYRRLPEDSAAVLAQGHRWMDADGILHERPAEPGPPAPSSQPAQPPAEGPRPGRTRRLPRALGVAITVVAIVPAALAEIGTRIGAGLKTIAADLINLITDIRRFKARAARLGRMLAAADPALVVVGQDPVGTELAFLLQHAHDRGTPSLMVPFAQFNLREYGEFAASRGDLALRGRPLNPVLATLYPHWAARFRGRRVLRLQGSRGLALELAGLVRGDPWIPWTEPVTAIACDSQRTRDDMAAMGSRADRIVVTGTPVMDRLAAHMASAEAGRAELVGTTGGRPGRPILVCGWPANIFAWVGGRRVLYPDYATLAEAWAGALASIRAEHDINVILSVHPKTLDEEVAAATARNLPLVRHASDVLIACCDMFTTLNGSSITSWALACGKPTLLFDCYATGYTEFADVPGCRIVHTEAEFVGGLARWAGSPQALAEATTEAGRDARSWGVLDGLAGRRLAALIERQIGGAGQAGR